jgi:hypothetical protein
MDASRTLGRRLLRASYLRRRRVRQHNIIRSLVYCRQAPNLLRPRGYCQHQHRRKQT